MFEQDLISFAKELSSDDPLSWALRRLGRVYAQVQNKGNAILAASRCVQHRMIVSTATIGIGLAHLDLVIARATETRDLRAVVEEAIRSLEAIIGGLDSILTFITSDKTKDEWQLVRDISDCLEIEDTLQRSIEQLAYRKDLTPIAVQNLATYYRGRIDSMAAQREALQVKQRALLVANGYSPEALEQEFKRLTEERDLLLSKKVETEPMFS